MKLLAFLMRRLYLIRWIDSALCALTIATTLWFTALLAYQEELNNLNLMPNISLWWFLTFPTLYFFFEILLLYLYRQATRLDDVHKLDRSYINKKDMVILDSRYKANLNDPGLIMIGNPLSFFDMKINFQDTKILSHSRIMGIIIGILTIALVLGQIMIVNFPVYFNFLVLIISLILIIGKVEKEDP